MSYVEVGLGYYPDPAKGKPVALGYVYVGIVDTDPEIVGNQKQVTLREEDGNEVQVSQPLRTGAGGVVLYNGSPVQVLVVGDYSLKVLDSQLTQVYYVPSNINGATGDDLLLADLRTLVTADGKHVHTSGRSSFNDGGGGDFIFNSSDLSTEVTADSLSGVYVAPDADLTGVSGAWVRQFDGDINCRWFGAHPDVSDNHDAIQAALDHPSVLTDRKPVYLPAGAYTVKDTLTINYVSVRLYGDSPDGGASGVSEIKGDFTTGPVIIVENRFQGLESLLISASAARTAGASQHGVRVEAEDSPGQRPTHNQYKNLVIKDQSGSGVYVVGACWFSTFDNIQSYGNGNSGMIFESGELTGRTNTENPGIVIINNYVAYDNEGHGLVIGDDGSNTNRGFRFQINNMDLYRNAESAGVRISADQAWCFLDSSRFESCAFDGSDQAQTATVTRGLKVGGRAVDINNCRFLNVTPNAVRVEEMVAGYGTQGVTVDNMTIFDTYGGMSLEPVVSIASECKNIRVAVGTIAENYSPIDVDVSIPIYKEQQVASVSSDITVNNSTTLTDVTPFTFQLLNKERVQFKAVLIFSGDAAADIKFGFSSPSGSFIRWCSSSGVVVDTSDVISQQDVITAANTLAVGASASERILEIVGHIETKGTAGDFTLQFAQNSAQVADTTVKEGSYMTCYR